MFRLSKNNDISCIMEIITQAQKSLKLLNINQWQDNYPNQDVILNDIANKESYVLEYKNKIVGTAVLSFNEEDSYNNISDGSWITNNTYGVIHRIAIDNTKKGKGFAKKILTEIEAICISNNVHSIKIDTHEDNKAMQSFLLKNNFLYCGVIYLLNGDKRLAYEKVIITT